MVCCSLLQIWPKFYHCNCCAVCTIVSYITAIYLESIAQRRPHMICRKHISLMKTPWHGNAFRITDPVGRQSVVDRWIPSKKDVYVFFNSLALRKFEWNFRCVIFKWILVIDGWSISCEIALIWMSLDFTDDQSTLVQVSPCWPRSLSPYGVTRPQWVDASLNKRASRLWFETSCHSMVFTVMCCIATSGNQ